jgi:hypothetical protein
MVNAMVFILLDFVVKLTEKRPCLSDRLLNEGRRNSLKNSLDYIWLIDSGTGYVTAICARVRVDALEWMLSCSVRMEMY